MWNTGKPPIGERVEVWFYTMIMTGIFDADKGWLHAPSGERFPGDITHWRRIGNGWA